MQYSICVIFNSLRAFVIVFLIFELIFDIFEIIGVGKSYNSTAIKIVIIIIIIEISKNFRLKIKI